MGRYLERARLFREKMNEKKYYYEWGIEFLDQDVQPQYWDTLPDMWRTISEGINGFKFIEDSHVKVFLSRDDRVDEDCGSDRDWIYVINGILPTEFEDSLNEVPQEYLEEFERNKGWLSMIGRNVLAITDFVEIGFYSGLIVDAVESGAVGSFARVVQYEWQVQEHDPAQKYITANAILAPDDPEYLTDRSGNKVHEAYRFGVDTSGKLIKEKRCAVTPSTMKYGLNKILSGDVKIAPWIKKACTHAQLELDGSYMDALCSKAVVEVALFDELIYA